MNSASIRRALRPALLSFGASALLAINLSAAQQQPKIATPVSAITVPEGFQVELVRSAETNEGSWVCMAVDNKGRLILSPQDKRQEMLRMTLGKGAKVQKIEKINVPVRSAMGLLYAFDSLYVNGDGPNKRGLYRLRDKNKNDQFEADEVEFLKRFEGDGEHGPHGIALGPDKKLYIMNGNHTKLPEGILPNSPHRNYQEDLLLPRMWDANGHAVGVMAPGGHVLRTDADGKEWELFCAGFRNSYDLDFNAEGDLFTFDSDMEWDWGTPWYRPTRVYMCVSGGEFGWRSGSGKWPRYYPDALPGILDVGIGSPTGVKFGSKSKFPRAYKDAFYICDWTYGRIIAVHLAPHGSSYAASMEPFVAVTKGTPLNLADVEFGKDGAMYFITGGRGTQSGLYRVSATGKAKEPRLPKVAKAEADQAKDFRNLRHKIEALHTKKDAGAIDFIWRFLNYGDRRRIRFVARIALEAQDVNLWKDRALAEQKTDAALAALTALARTGGKELQLDLLEALGNLRWDLMSEEQQIRGLRVLQLAFIRMGAPESQVRDEVIARLDASFPAPSEALNREVAQVLIYLEAPGVAAKCLDLIEKGKTQEDQLYYVFILRNLKKGWTLDQRKAYFSWFTKDRSKLAHPPELLQWFADVGEKYRDGASFVKFLANIKKEAEATLTDEERKALAAILDGTAVAEAATPQHAAKEWSTADIDALLEASARSRSFENGKELFAKTQCLACHRFGNEGGSVGPDLSAISSRFTRRDVLASILEPSTVLSEQYQNLVFRLKDGSAVTGRLMDVVGDKLKISPNPLADEFVEVAVAEVESREPSPVSPMPEGLISGLTREDVHDLLAYMESAGRPDAAVYKTRSNDRTTHAAAGN